MTYYVAGPFRSPTIARRAKPQRKAGTRSVKRWGKGKKKRYYLVIKTGKSAGKRRGRMTHARGKSGATHERA